MTIGSSLIYVLPQKFFWVIPLHIGVEIILFIAIFNKAGGAYGVLSIITGHPINFLQWLYNLLALMVLPFYISGLINLRVKAVNVQKTSLTTLVYISDTVLGSLYTLYFIYFWFSNEDKAIFNGPTSESSAQRRDIETGQTNTNSQGGTQVDLNSSDSASPARELFLTSSTILVVTIVRFYSTLVILSYAKALLKQASLSKRYGDDNDNRPTTFEDNNGKGITGKIKIYVNDLEVKSVDILQDFFG